MNNLILCPICKKHHFLKQENNTTNNCPHCGWQYDSMAEKNPFEKYGSNDLSLNEYKLRYDYYLEQNPNYYWLNDKFPKLPNVEPMLCPVCNKYHFEKMTLEDLCCGILPSDISCRICGWHYDKKQQDDTTLKDGANAMSLCEYKEWYQNKLKINPDYTYFEEQTSTYVPSPHLCPVCNKYKFKDKSSHEICKFCGWEDDSVMESEPNQWEGCANDLCLNDYKKRYKSYLKINPDYKYIKDGKIKK